VCATVVHTVYATDPTFFSSSRWTQVMQVFFSSQGVRNWRNFFQFPPVHATEGLDRNFAYAPT
jgi:hypothetical protein